ncbi:alanine--tRNA ligase [Dinghuibacter silviterrae]|uniref:Alanine--tRNA ligase n=1 Tax=Dinghuibacter silviterrae TaxID=1539049 RepID=A0A4R8DN75_9BACT|nr:alanine--tRNA ligase [Dinghuibacter silviterrae]TDW99479.1 alanyl-tRNA synthetase [Dinghuibacter silviterrae]
MTSDSIRTTFLDFFRSKGHEIVPSAPIVIKNDPTLLFTNAGMNQFKDFFLGNREPGHRRVADTQKCLRVSGKHNDLEEVGVDTYHHTMFEMLGNWSFGDYFKKEAISWSWELLTGVYKIPKDRIYVTVFGGDKAEGLAMDEEAQDLWKQHVDADRILHGNKKDNFWEMGDTGPCGPCSEIHMDCRTDVERLAVDGKTLVNADHPQVIEIWNIVFMQFNRLKDGRLEPLPARHVDTGMGFERLVRVLQGKQSNYDTDVFSGTIARTERLTGKTYTGDDSKVSVAFRVIADHIRAIGFTIADGQLPSNTGAGYVIRRILRRAVRYYYSYLDYKQPLLHQLMDGLADQFAGVFPELKAQVEFVTKVVKEEEDAFLRTLEKGLKKMEDIVGEAGAVRATATVIDGKAAFELYDTYGFPFDLTKLIASENGLGVDEKGFAAEMALQKERSRAATALDTDDWVVLNNEGGSRFIGYDSLETVTGVSRYRKIKAKNKESFQIVLETTPFYAESGGQVGDTGLLTFGEEAIPVEDTKKENNLTIQFVPRLPEVLDGPVLAQVDPELRKATAVHHTATHLLHAALRKVLGTHVAQKGSLVNAEYLRFDFSHFAKVTDAEIAEVEAIVNQKIRENIPVMIREMPKDEAVAMGAMALFGEKYGDRVRVVIIDPSYSIELCGGTHVGSTGELGFFKVTAESAVAAGVRRVEAVAGPASERYLNGQLGVVKAVREQLKNAKDPVAALESLLQEHAEVKKRLERLEAKQLAALSRELAAGAVAVGDVRFVGAVVDVPSADALKKVCFDLKPLLEAAYVVVLAAAIEGKASVAVMIDEALVTGRGWEAPKWIKERVAPLISGGGGGQKSLATAGGQDTSKLAAVIEAVRAAIQ